MKNFPRKTVSIFGCMNAHSITLLILLLFFPCLAYSTTGIQSLGALRYFVWFLGLFALSFIVVCFLVYYIKNKKIRVGIALGYVLFIPIFILFVSYEGIDFHYPSPVENLPKDISLEPAEVLSSHFLRRKNGDVVFFHKGIKLGYGYKVDSESLIDFSPKKTRYMNNTFQVSAHAYVEKRKYTLPDKNSRLLTIPIIGVPVDKHVLLMISGSKEILTGDWQGTGRMLYLSTGYQSSEKWIDELLQHGASINYQDPVNKDTSLHNAILKRQLNLARFLISRGARVDVKNKQWKTPLSYLKTSLSTLRDLKHSDQYQELLDQLDKNWKATGAMLIDATEHPKLVKLFAERGADLNYVAQHSWGKQPALHYAIKNGNFESAIILIEAGADLKKKNKFQKTPLEVFGLVSSMLAKKDPRNKKRLKRLLESKTL